MPNVTSYSKHEWRVGITLVISYVVVFTISSQVLPPWAAIFPASAISLASLFFGGIRIWPFAYAAALISSTLTGAPPGFILVFPIADAAQATFGAYLLRSARIDPLFRRYRDAFNLLTSAVLTSFIIPTALIATDDTQGRPFSMWSHEYAATLLMLLVVVPFILRWFAKPRFSRRPGEGAETVIIFVLLVGIEYALFVERVAAVNGMPLVYFMLVPLFWIALRLRPRFLTLALLITSIFGIWSVIANSTAATLDARLFSIELFLIVITTIFSIVVSLEEDRRVNMNLMRSQLATLENAVSRISTESSAKNDFIAILAHELRNPLAPVLSAIELLKLKGPRDEEDAETFAMMEDRMGTVKRLLDDLLDISRITEGKVVMTRETVELGSVVRRALLSTNHYRSERHQHLEFHPSKNALVVEGDPVRLEQIVSNLLTNASKYSDPGDSITLTVREEDGKALIEVEDEGVGIPPESLRTVFMPFHQLDEGERSKKGLGIGLALVRSFAEAHGGSVTAVSKGTGAGSRFIISLPLSHTASAPKEDMPAHIGLQRTDRGAGARILVVDDNDVAAAGIGRLLEMRGCSVSYAYDGRQAIDFTLSHVPDAVILDVGLPDQDGYAVAKTLRDRGYAGRLVALTGYSNDEARARGEAAGFDHYLVKPASLEELRRALPGLA